MEFILTYNLHRSTFSVSRRERIVSMREKCDAEFIKEAKKILHLVHGKDETITLLSIQKNERKIRREPLLLSEDGIVLNNLNP